MKNNKLKIFLGVWIVITAFVIVTVQALVFSKNVKIQTIKNELAQIDVRNSGLQMKIYELSSLEKMKALAAKEGLSYNNSNIIKIVNRSN